MIFNEIKCHVNTSLGLGCIPCPPHLCPRLPIWRVKKQCCQVIRFQPVHILKVLQLSSDFDCHPILSKF